MKKFLKIIGLIALGIIILIAAVFFFTRELPKQGNQFLTYIFQENYEEAYEMTSSLFQKKYESEEYFDQIIPDELKDEAIFSSAFWTSREISGGLGRISGTVTLSDGTVIPTELSFSKENDEWRVAGFYFGR